MQNTARDAEVTLTIPATWKRRVHPRRGFASAAGTTKLDAKKSLETSRAHYLSLQKKLLAGASQAVADGALIREVDARWMNTKGPTDARVEGAIGALARFRKDYDQSPAGEAIIDHWVTAAGLTFAVDATLSSLRFAIGIQPKKEWEDARWFALAPIENEKNLASFDAPGFVERANDARPMLLRLRRLLAEASAADYAAASKAALAHRKDKKAYIVRVAATYLFPTERAWVEEDIADFAKRAEPKATSELRCWHPTHARLLLTTITRFSDYLALNGVRSTKELGDEPMELAATPHSVLSKEASANYLPTLLEGMGAELEPLCRYWCEHWAAHKDLALALAAIPTDSAMDTLFDHAGNKDVLAALTEAVSAFPDRAARRIAERVQKKGKNYKLVEAFKPAKSTEAPPTKATSATKQDTAASDALPQVLVNPPWARKGSAPKGNAKATKPEPMEIAMLPYTPSFAWAEGEKERFATTDWDPSALEPGGYLETLQKGKWLPATPFTQWTPAQWAKLNTDWESKLTIVHGPEDISLALQAEHAAHAKYYFEPQLAVARHEVRVFPDVLRAAAAHPAEAVLAEGLGPFDAAELAPVVASTLRLKKLTKKAEAWLLRHPRASAVGLIPGAVGREKSKKDAAIAGLQLLMQSGHDAVVQEVTEAYGPALRAALTPLLGKDPRLAKAPPKPPTFWKPATFPTVKLRSGAALPSEALDNLRIMLALNELGRPFPGLSEALAACDRSSLAAFGWALFLAWQRAGSSNDEKWAFVALGVLGDDHAARELTPLIRRWPGESSHARAAMGLEVLAAIGSDIALMSIHGIAERLKFPALKELAQESIAAIAKRRGLSLAELEDRLVPTLDLDDAGTLLLDYGSRHFTVGFDETLTPFVRDATTRLATLPKPGAKDNAEKAKSAQATFAALKNDVRAIGQIQLARLERAMIAQRSWSTDDFSALLVRHPLLIHIVRRLVWATYEDARLISTFRVAEDRTLATIDDTVFTLNPKHAVRLAHPTQLDATVLSGWGKVFGEYELLQPFPQLGRGRYSKAEVARLLKKLARMTVPTGKVLGLGKLGWKRGSPQDSGHIGNMVRESSIGPLRLELEQGFNVSAVGEHPEQTLEGIFAGSSPLDAKALERLPDLEASELAYSLSSLLG